MPGDTRVVRGTTAQRRGRANIPLQSGVLWDWSEAAPPQAYNAANGRGDWEARLPSTPQIYTAAAGVYDLNTVLTMAMTTYPTGRVLIRLLAGVYHMNEFKKIGSGGQTYAFGLWHSRLIGFSGVGYDQTYIQMDANSISQVQLDEMATMTRASFQPMAMGIMRLDGLNTDYCFLGGITFRAADQNLIYNVAADLKTTDSVFTVPVFTPQPAPHNGVVFYAGTTAYVSHCRFQAAGRAILSQPPFECTNLGSQYGKIYIYKTEFDGRRSPDLDPARPRRCNVIMPNNDEVHQMEDVWMHHSNVSRYAANDENRDTASVYTVKNFKIEHITDTRNTDPALNNGQPLGGASPVTPFGWESSRGQITLQNGIIDQGVNWTNNGQYPAHFQMTDVGAGPVRRRGGRFKMMNVVCINTGYPEADGFIIARIGTGSWWQVDGYETTIEVYHPVSGARLTPYALPGWPPNKTTLAGQGILPETHYLVKGA